MVIVWVFHIAVVTLFYRQITGDPLQGITAIPVLISVFTRGGGKKISVYYQGALLLQRSNNSRIVICSALVPLFPTKTGESQTLAVSSAGVFFGPGRNPIES